MTSYKVMHGTTDVTTSYTFGTSVDGTLEVTKRKVILTSATDSKVFDENSVTALTNHNVVITGDGWVDGEGVDYTFTGSQTFVGSSKNTYSYKAKTGTDLDNYSIEVVEGTLTVTGEPIIPEKTTPEVTSNYKLGDSIPFTITVHNVKDATVTNVTIEDLNAVITAGSGYTVVDEHHAAIASLATDATVTITANHIVTSDDILAAKVGNTATITWDNFTKDVSAETKKIVPIDVTLGVVKTSDVEGKAEYGQTINYTIKVTNNGNVPLHNVKVTDAMTADSWTIETLAVGEVKEYTAAYKVVENDVVAGSITNTAIVNADDVANPLDKADPYKPAGQASVTDSVNRIFSYTVHHLDIIGSTPIEADSTGKAEYGTVVDVKALTNNSIEHYVYNSNDADITIGVGTNESNIYYDRQSLLSIFYNYQNGGMAADSHIVTMNYGDVYDVVTPDLEGYTPDIDRVAGTIDQDEISVTVTYIPNVYNFTVRFIDNGTGQVMATTVGSAAFKTAVNAATYSSRKFNGYHLARTSGNIVIGTGTNIINIYYAVNDTPIVVSYSLTIYYHYLDGTQAAPTFTTRLGAGTDYSYDSPVLTNYDVDVATVSGTMPSSDVTVTVTYTRQAENIDPNVTPLDGGSWALVNLICTILTVLLACVLLITFISKKHSDDEEEKDEKNSTVKAENAEDKDDDQQDTNKHGWRRLVSVVLAVASVITFVLTENMSLPMTMVDKWTVLMVVMGLIQVVIAIISRKKKKNDEDEDDDKKAANA